jgi:hypothetical protein
MFKVTVEEIQKYRETNEIGIQEAKDILLKQKLINHLQQGGTAEPVLLFLLQDWLGTDFEKD